MDNDDGYKMKYWFGYEQHDVVLLIMLVTSFMVMMQQEKVNTLRRFSRDPIFVGNLLFVVVFSLWIIYFNRVEDAKNEDDKNHTAFQKF